MSNPTPLPPSVAELRDTIVKFFDGRPHGPLNSHRKALNRLCELASRADPAPVADEAAIRAQITEFGRASEAVARVGELSADREMVSRRESARERLVAIMRAAPRPVASDEFAPRRVFRPVVADVVIDGCPDVVKFSVDTNGDGNYRVLVSAATRNDDKLRREILDLRRWAKTHFDEACVDQNANREQFWSGHDMAYRNVLKLLAESSAGDAPLAEAVDIIRRHAAVSDDLRARLQAAEAKRDEKYAELADVRGELSDVHAERAAAIRDRQDAEAERDKLAADLAAAQKERDWWKTKHADDAGGMVTKWKESQAMLNNAVTIVEESREAAGCQPGQRLQHRCAELVNDLAATKAESAKAAVELPVLLLDKVERMFDHCPFCGCSLDTGWECNNERCGIDCKPLVDKLRAAQPQPTTAAPATVRQGDEVLREFLNYANDFNRDEKLDSGLCALVELCKRALEGKP